MENLNQEPPKRIPLLISGDENEGRVILGGRDITNDVHRLVVDLTAFDCIATLELQVDVEFDFPVSTVAVAGDPLEGITAKELNDAAANRPMSSTMGDHLLKHLRERSAGGSQ